MHQSWAWNARFLPLCELCLWPTIRFKNLQKKALDLVSERKWKERPQKIIHTTLKLNLYYRGPRNVGYKSGTHVTILQNAHSVTFMLFLWHPFMGKVCICSSRPFRSFWDFLGLFGTFWDFLGPLGTFRDL